MLVVFRRAPHFTANKVLVTTQKKPRSFKAEFSVRDLSGADALYQRFHQFIKVIMAEGVYDGAIGIDLGMRWSLDLSATD